MWRDMCACKQRDNTDGEYIYMRSGRADDVNSCHTHKISRWYVEESFAIFTRSIVCPICESRIIMIYPMLSM